MTGVQTCALPIYDEACLQAALGRAEARQAGLRRAQRYHVIGELALQERCCIGAARTDRAEVGQGHGAMDRKRCVHA